MKEQVIIPVSLQNWMVLFAKRDESKAFEFVNMMRKVTPALGIQVVDPMMVVVRDDRTETYLRTIRENLHPQVQVVVVIFPTSRDDRYAAVKKLCCVESPVPSQVGLSLSLSLSSFLSVPFTFHCASFCCFVFWNVFRTSVE